MQLAGGGVTIAMRKVATDEYTVHESPYSEVVHVYGAQLLP